MDDVVLLSEIHPLGSRWFHALQQAHAWYGLASAEEVKRYCLANEEGFLDAIELILSRCVARNRRLIVRDWSHLDFHGRPFVDSPSYRLRTSELLSKRFKVLRIATVRHPLDQYLSLRELGSMRGHLTLAHFLRGYRRFAEHCAEMAFFRYESFVAEPNSVLQEMCRQLAVSFDPQYADRWPTYTRVTGDPIRGTGTEIKARPRRNVDSELAPPIGRKFRLFGGTSPAGI